jgi:HPt (histidine-containing phosphotransfer) domain-containing protein
VLIGKDGIKVSSPTGKTDRMTDAPIYNKAAYLSFCDDVGAEDAAEVLVAFFEDTGLKVNALPSLADRQVIKREAHSIKSSSATFGFARLSALGRDLEFGAETTSPADLQTMIAAIQQAFDATKTFAQKEMLGAGLAVA